MDSPSNHKSLLPYAPLVVLLQFLAAGAAAGDMAVSLQFDNDLLSSSDRNYTSGMRLSASNEAPAGEGIGFHALDKVNAWLGLKHSEGAATRVNTYGLSLLIFTPEDVDALVPPTGERPYAGYLSLARAYRKATESTSSTLTLSIGLTGPNALAEDAQDWAHRINDEERFKGWESQVPEEIVIQAAYDRRFRAIDLIPGETGVAADIWWEHGFGLGNYRTFAYGGTSVRIGSHLHGYHSVPEIHPSSLSQSNPYREAQSNDWQWFAYLAGRVNAVAHDITLDGPLFREYEYAVESRPFVGEASIGLGVSRGSYEFLISHTFLTEVFESQNDNHDYASMMILYRF